MYWVLAVFGGIEHAAVPKLEPLMRLMLSKNFGYKVQSSLRDSGEYDENPGVKTPGYFRVVAARLKTVCCDNGFLSLPTTYDCTGAGRGEMA